MTPTGLVLGLIFSAPTSSLSRFLVQARRFSKLTPTGLMTAPQTNVIYEVFSILVWVGLVLGSETCKKNKPHPSQFGIPIGVRFEKHRASTRKTRFRGQLCSPRNGGTPKREVMRGQKDLYILLHLFGPAPYIDLFRSQIQFVRRLVSHIRLSLQMNLVCF